METQTHQRFSLKALFALVAYFALLAMGLSLPTSWWVDVCVLVTLLMLLWLWRYAWTGSPDQFRSACRTAAVFGSVYFVLIFLAPVPNIWPYLLTSKGLGLAHDKVHGIAADSSGAPPDYVATIDWYRAINLAKQGRYWPHPNRDVAEYDKSLRGFCCVGHCLFTALFAALGGVQWRRPS